MEGQGDFTARYPPSPFPTSFPSLSMIEDSIPGRGPQAEPGLVLVTPGNGEIIIEPVSVCHQVSTIAHFSLPIYSWYHIHASGFIGSPTVPSNLNDDRSCA